MDALTFPLPDSWMDALTFAPAELMDALTSALNVAGRARTVVVIGLMATRHLPG
jgi:hypothetical protein